jgi:hypothetical protein
LGVGLDSVAFAEDDDVHSTDVTCGETASPWTTRRRPTSRQPAATV